MLTPDQAAALDQLPRYYTVGHLVDVVFAGDQDAFVDAWARRDLPLAVRRVCEELTPPGQQQAWLLQRILLVLLAGQGDPPS